MPSMTDTVLAPDCRRTSMMTVGLPSRRARLRCSLVPSSTRPTSRMRNGTPPRLVMTMSAKSAGAVTRPIVRKVRSLTSVVTLPPGRSAFWRTSASRTALTGMP